MSVFILDCEDKGFLTVYISGSVKDKKIYQNNFSHVNATSCLKRPLLLGLRNFLDSKSLQDELCALPAAKTECICCTRDTASPKLLAIGVQQSNVKNNSSCFINKCKKSW
jgi:hypothetical protein